MRDILLNILLMIVFAWQALTARFYPDPKEQVQIAQQWLEQNARHATRLTPELISRAHRAGFSPQEVAAATLDQLRHEEPWNKLPVARLYRFNKAIPSRPAWAVTDVTALMALDSKDCVLTVQINTNRTTL